MFGAMPKTRLMFEGQITKEYLGFSTHLAFLAPLWQEALDAGPGRGGTVADAVRGGGMAGVANIGSDRKRTGGHLDQAKRYALAPLAGASGPPGPDNQPDWEIRKTSGRER